MTTRVIGDAGYRPAGRRFRAVLRVGRFRALEAFHQTRPDLVLLDVMLPGKDGIEVCRAIRAESGVPIVMLTAKTDTVDVVLGLESVPTTTSSSRSNQGTDRTHPHTSASPRRREARTHPLGDLSIDVAGHCVRRDGQVIDLTPLEFDLLVCLARKPWQVFSREVLLQDVWGTGTRPTPVWSTSTSNVCAPRSSTTRRIPNWS